MDSNFYRPGDLPGNEQKNGQTGGAESRKQMDSPAESAQQERKKTEWQGQKQKRSGGILLVAVLCLCAIVLTAIRLGRKPAAPEAPPTAVEELPTAAAESPTTAEYILAERPSALPTQRAAEGPLALTEENLTFDEENGALYANSYVLLTFQSDLPSDRQGQILSELGCTASETMDSAGIVKAALPGLQELSLDELMSRTDDIEAIYPEEIVVCTCDCAIASDSILPEDPWTVSYTEDGAGRTAGPQTWDESSPDGENWYLEAIHALSAWSMTQDVSPVTVGVVDENINANHVELQNSLRMLSSKNSAGGNYHGTAVCGVIGAEWNQTGVSGVLKNASIMGISVEYSFTEKLLTSLGFSCFTSTSLEAVGRQIQSGAKVINLSLGYTAPNEQWSTKLSLKTAEMCAAFLARYLNSGYDFLIVQAAGNSHLDSRSNSLFCYDDFEDDRLFNYVPFHFIRQHILIVGYARNNGDGTYSSADFSNYGPGVDVYAPGEGILCCFGDDEYIMYDGSSFAAPICAASAALVWGADTNLSAPEVRQLLLDTATTPVTPLPVDPCQCRMIDLGQAVERVTGKKPVDVTGTWQALTPLSGFSYLRQLSFREDGTFSYARGYAYSEYDFDASGTYELVNTLPDGSVQVEMDGMGNRTTQSVSSDGYAVEALPFHTVITFFLRPDGALTLTGVSGDNEMLFVSEDSVTLERSEGMPK